MAHFIKSANFVSQYFVDHRKQICFVGRSNAGKSSLINALANEKIAKTSSTPGKTQLVNFFDFKKNVLVDLPGYGYTKLNKKDSIQIQTLIFEYINYAQKIGAIFQLCSIDVITEQDKQISVELMNVCNKYQIKYYVVLTKCDKISFSQQKIQQKKASQFFNISEDKVIVVSSKNKININQLEGIINKTI